MQLELGGKNPAVVVDCDDLDDAAREIVAAAFLCSGQRCTAISRVIVSEAQADALGRADPRAMSAASRSATAWSRHDDGAAGEPRPARTVDGYVRQGVDAGCALLTGGGAADGRSRSGTAIYYAPTVFDRVPPDSPLALEEIFGPVLPILRVRDLDEAIASPTARATGWRRRCSRRGWAPSTSSRRASRPA